MYRYVPSVEHPEVESLGRLWHPLAPLCKLYIYPYWTSGVAFETVLTTIHLGLRYCGIFSLHLC
jgi:hypothetical protein